MVTEACRVTGLTIEQLADRLGYKSLPRAVWGEIPLPDSKRRHIRDIIRLHELEKATKNVVREDFPDLIEARNPLVPAASKEIGPRAALRAARLAKGLTIPQLAKLVRRDAAYLSSLEDGTAPISENTAEILARELSISKEELLGGSDQPPIHDVTGVVATYGALVKMQLPPGVKGRYVPLLSYGEAGPLDADHSDAFYSHEGVMAMDVDDRSAFAIKVHGKSMEDALFDGDYVVCSPRARLELRQAAVIKTRSGQILIKFWDREGANTNAKVVLRSKNPDYQPIILPPEEILGAWPIVQRVDRRKITIQL